MSSGAHHYREAERLAAMAHHYTYGDGVDPVRGRALATEALTHATLAAAAAAAARITPDDVDPGTWAEWRRAIDDSTAHPEQIAAREYTDAG
ncbi:hypothetical protein [Embleya sp. NPDC020630]|uniref:hypothetical protein n=1 Tax=Embleya sp. NPDC020630 TaxID=3363979 RepID=UPI0037933D0C